jgi:hypothetical protein
VIRSSVAARLLLAYIAPKEPIMHPIRPPQRLRRQMPLARPVSTLSSELCNELGPSATDCGETERSFMDRILICDRLTWEAAERCAALHREQGALLRAQTSARDAETGGSNEEGSELLRGILAAQLERNRERLEHAERSYRGATQLLRDTITEALATRMAPGAIARVVESIGEPEVSGGLR